MSRWIAIGLIAISGAVLGADAASAQACREIRFAAGASSGVIEGEIPPDAQLCYTIEVGNGQTAEATIQGPDEQFPIIMVDGITREGGDQTAVWQTLAGTYTIKVMTLFRYGANTPFRLEISVTGG
jgi:hypothetical protein